MRISRKGIDLLKSLEAFRGEAYGDVGKKLTIGYGDTRNVKPGMKITEPAAEKLLLQRLEEYENRIKKYIKVPLNQNQHDALMIFDYNTNGLTQFDKKEKKLKLSTLTNKLNEGKYDEAFNVELPKWNKVKGKVIKGLVNRRKYEQELANLPYEEEESE